MAYSLILLTIVLENADFSARQTAAKHERGVIELVTDDQGALLQRVSTESV